MSTNTPQGLIKPQGTDTADLTVFVGQNMDKLDGLITSNQNNINQNSINIIKNAFSISALQNASKYGMKNTVIDDYNDATGINASASSGYTLSGGVLSCINGVITPTNMTSDNAPSPYVASASGEYTTANGAFAAFDGSLSTYWSGTLHVYTGWLAIDLGYAFNPTQYSITARSSAEYQTPMNWTFEGSSDGNTWTVLDTQSSQSFTTSNQKRTYTVSQPVSSYRHFRLNISAPQTNTDLISVAEFQISGTSGTATIVSTLDTATSAPTNIILDAQYSLGANGTIKFEISRDGGTTWTQVQSDTLTNISSQPTGTSIVSRVTLTGTATITSIGYSWQ